MKLYTDRLYEYVTRFLKPTDQEWEDYRSCLQVKHIAKDHFFLKEGEICNHVAFINEGLLRSYMQLDGAEQTHQFFFDGNYVTNYVSFLSRKPSYENVVAMKDSELLMVSYGDLQKMYDKHKIWERFGRLIAEYLFQWVAQRNHAMLTSNPDDLYLKLVRERPKVIQQIPQYYIASYLGIKPETLSRVRKRIQEKI